MFLENKKENTELSTHVITHKLKIKWEPVKYISKKMADDIFNQLADKNLTSITIANPKTLTFLIKYKNEVDLIPLDKESADLEDLLYLNNLNDYQKEKVRDIRDMRKKERKPRNIGNLKIIIEMIKLWEA